jgi:hypothetical protein
MGAFGRELQAHFGGTKHDVRTWGNSKSEEEVKSNQEIDEKPKRFKYKTPDIVSRLETNIMYGFVDPYKITKEIFLSVKGLTKRDWRRFQLFVYENKSWINKVLKN